MPTDSALSRVSAPSRIAFNSLPKRFTDPSLGRSKPIARFKSVVLPEPDGPQTATHSSVDTVKSTSARASMVRPRTRYVFHACSMWIAFVTPHLLFAARTGSKRRSGGNRLGTRRQESHSRQRHSAFAAIRCHSSTFISELGSGIRRLFPIAMVRQNSRGLLLAVAVFLAKTIYLK